MERALTKSTRHNSYEKPPNKYLHICKNALKLIEVKKWLILENLKQMYYVESHKCILWKWTVFRNSSPFFLRTTYTCIYTHVFGGSTHIRTHSVRLFYDHITSVVIQTIGQQKCRTKIFNIFVWHCCLLVWKMFLLRKKNYLPLTLVTTDSKHFYLFLPQTFQSYSTRDFAPTLSPSCILCFCLTSVLGFLYLFSLTTDLLNRTNCLHAKSVIAACPPWLSFCLE